MKKLLLFVLLGCLFLAPALADRPVDEIVAADPDGEVSVELIAGTVRVIGWERSEVHVTGTVGDDVEEVEVVSRGGNVAIEVELPDDDDDSSSSRSFNDADADLEIHVPAGCLVEVEGISADISVEGVRGAVDLESISGEIEVDGAMQEAEVATVSGDIVLSSAEALRDGDFESVSGSIEVRAALVDGDFSFETVSGNVELHLPGNTSASFDIETFSGRIENDFGPEAERTSEYAPGKELEFTTGGGDAQVEIESFSGRIELRVD